MTQLDIAGLDAATLETAPTRYIEGRGVRFAYRRLGPATGTPLVLLQHFSGNIDAWDPAVVNALAADRPVIAFDNAGVGRSTGKTPDSIAAMARDAVVLIELLGFSEVDLLGFSLGGCVSDRPVIYVAGNHEAYGCDIDRTIIHRSAALIEDVRTCSTESLEVRSGISSSTPW